MGRILVVANETLHAEALGEVLRARAAAGDRLRVVVPLRIPVYADLGGLGMYGFASLEAGDAAAIEADARLRLEELLDELEAAGVSATGRVHAVDPMNAV